MFRWFKNVQDPISSYTHFLGACFGVIATLVFIAAGVANQRPLKTILACCVFSASMIALYSASSYYHTLSWDHPHHTLFRKLDHSMIYVLIAGTYTPLCLTYLPGREGITLAVVIWTIALAGIIAKICWLSAPRILYTLLYLAMGWAVLFDWSGFSQMPSGCLMLIALGGIAYTIGAVIYMIKKPDLSKQWGFHELFHLFILLGSFFHFIAVLSYILL